MIIIRSFINFLVLFGLITNVLCTTTGEPLPDTSNDPFLKEMVEGLKDIQSKFSDIPAKNTRIAESTNIKISDESEAKRIAKYAGAAYCSDLTLKPWTCKHCRDLGSNIKVKGVFTDILTGGRSFIATDPVKKQIILSFRGSSNIRNWLADFSILLTNYKVNEADSGIKVHLGFRNSVNALYPKFSTLLKTLLALHPDYKLIITGHSLGGAIATLAAIEIHKNFKLPWNRIQLFTYGQPRVGNVAFAKWMNNQSLTSTRVVNNRDTVAHVPPRKLGYSHHQREMHLKNNKAKVCSTHVLEDPTCALSAEPFLSILNHLTYWDTHLGGIC